MNRLDRTVPPAYKTVDNLSFEWPKNIGANIPIFVLKKSASQLIQLTVVTGSSRCNESHPGVASMTGKMLLEGTVNKDTKQIAAYIDYYGAHINIVQRPDYGSIELMTLSKYLPIMVELLVELIQSPLFPEEQIAQLKKIKLQELKVQNEQNSILAYSNYQEAVLGKHHPYSYRLSPNYIIAITREHLFEHYQKNWLPVSQILLSGDIQEQDIALVQRSFSFLQFNERPTTSPELLIQPPTKVHIPKQGSLQCAICIGKVFFPQTHPDYPALYVVTMLLGGYFGSRLMCNLREEKGYTYHIDATLIPLKAATYFVITVEVMQKFAAKACQEIYHEISILQNEEVSQEELNKLRNYLIGNFLAKLDDPFYVMEKFKDMHLKQLDQNFYYQLFDTIRHITPKQIQHIAQQYLALDSLTEVCVG